MRGIVGGDAQRTRQPRIQRAARQRRMTRQQAQQGERVRVRGRGRDAAGGVFRGMCIHRAFEDAFEFAHRVHEARRRCRPQRRPGASRIEVHREPRRQQHFLRAEPVGNPAAAHVDPAAAVGVLPHVEIAAEVDQLRRAGVDAEIARRRPDARAQVTSIQRDAMLAAARLDQAQRRLRRQPEAADACDRDGQRFLRAGLQRRAGREPRRRRGGRLDAPRPSVAPRQPPGIARVQHQARRKTGRQPHRRAAPAARARRRLRLPFADAARRGAVRRQQRAQAAQVRIAGRGRVPQRIVEVIHARTPALARDPDPAPRAAWPCRDAG
jgi:hypothetical protein